MTQQEQDFLDRCAIEAMGALVGNEIASTSSMSSGETSGTYISRLAYRWADYMLTERRKRMEAEVQARPPKPKPCFECSYWAVERPKLPWCDEHIRTLGGIKMSDVNIAGHAEVQAELDNPNEAI